MKDDPTNRKTMDRGREKVTKQRQKRKRDSDRKEIPLASWGV
jgi:hypothetical protein